MIFLGIISMILWKFGVSFKTTDPFLGSVEIKRVENGALNLECCQNPFKGKVDQAERYGRKLFITSNFIKKSLWSIIISVQMLNQPSVRLRRNSVNQLNLKIELPKRMNCCVRLSHIILQC